MEALPPTWFVAGAEPLLIEYCRCVVRARVLAKELDAVDVSELRTSTATLKRYDKLALMADREGKAMVNLGRALRINPHARMRAENAGRAASRVPGRKPWA